MSMAHLDSLLHMRTQLGYQYVTNFPGLPHTNLSDSFLETAGNTAVALGAQSFEISVQGNKTK
jgi:hypothetical protein